MTPKRTILVTGSSGLVGSEVVRHYDRTGHRVLGIDNNSRSVFFGVDGDTAWREAELRTHCRHYEHIDVDVRDRDRVTTIVRDAQPTEVIHCAAQPSHDLAANIPFDDFETNALGTLNLLEAVRHHSPEATFVLLSTNKVYGDSPNRLELHELPTRWEFADPRYANGIDETMTVDQSLHSLFGVSKAAADLLTQEYGRYFGLKTVCFRCGCVTGAGHSAAKLHGYLAYLFKCAAAGVPYTVIGYGGKQVRDQIHARDVVLAIEAFAASPRSGAVYNLGGGKSNSVSIVESIERIEQLKYEVTWTVDEHARKGDHICYYTDLSRFRRDYPSWNLTICLDAIFDELAEATFVAT